VVVCARIGEVKDVEVDGNINCGHLESVSTRFSIPRAGSRAAPLRQPRPLRWRDEGHVI